VHTGRFTDRARAYASTRPMHPPEAVTYVLAGLGDAARLHVADLGSGTGLSARAFAASAARVSAIEPNAAMRAAAGAHPRIASIDASAEATTLVDNSVDVVTACTAWHWFDHALVLPEIRRILKPRGRLAVLEINFDETDGFTKAWRTVFWQFGKRVPQMPGNLIDHAISLNPGAVSQAEFPFSHAMDRAGLHAYTDSNSLAPADGPAYDGLHAAIDALLDDLGSPRTVALKRVSTVLRVDR
jgi:SAM-dependent methyltransferase